MGWYSATITLTAEKAPSCCRSAGWNICLWGWSLVCVGLARTPGVLQATLALFMIASWGNWAMPNFLHPEEFCHNPLWIICIPCHIQILILWADHRISWILLHSVNALTELFNDPYRSLPTQDVWFYNVLRRYLSLSPTPAAVQTNKRYFIVPHCLVGTDPKPLLSVYKQKACSLIKSKCYG